MYVCNVNALSVELPNLDLLKVVPKGRVLMNLLLKDWLLVLRDYLT